MFAAAYDWMWFRKKLTTGYGWLLCIAFDRNTTRLTCDAPFAISKFATRFS
jgi:hypothetical protein